MRRNAIRRHSDFGLRERSARRQPPGLKPGASTMQYSRAKYTCYNKKKGLGKHSAAISRIPDRL